MGFHVLLNAYAGRNANRTPGFANMAGPRGGRAVIAEPGANAAARIESATGKA